MILYIFNPEHDLCLANGDPNYVPPASALQFAVQGKGIMRILYGDEGYVVAADELQQWKRDHPNEQVSMVIAWGWDRRVWNMLLKNNIHPTLHPLPYDEDLKLIRFFQHRGSLLSLQSHAHEARSVEAIESMLRTEHRMVLKAPLSGSGRGLRWVDNALSEHDRQWVQKVVAQQGSVIVERRIDVALNFAFEYYVTEHKVELTGLSLFENQSGVYRHNVLLPDYEIRNLVGPSHSIEERIMEWLRINIQTWYEGPLGIDMMRDRDGNFFVGEMNLRHTMGMVAHRYLQQHPERRGSLFSPTDLFTKPIDTTY